MEKFAELKNVPLNDMVLLHEKDSHFDLIVSKDSDLAKLGSLSYRFNVGPLMNQNDQTKDCEDEPEAADETENLNGTKEEMQKLLKICKEEKKKITSEYYKVEKELRMKVEETEKLKIKVKDLKEIMKLEKELKETNIKSSSKDANKEDFSWQVVKCPVKLQLGQVRKWFVGGLT